MNVADFLETDEKYFDYFNRALNRRINYFKYNYVFGDSTSARLSYIKKSECENFTEGLINLIIPYTYTQGFFRALPDAESKLKFEIIKEDLKQDIYYNTKFQNAELVEFKNELKIFPENLSDNFIHYKDNGDGTFHKSSENISKFIDECILTTKFVKSSKWYLSFEYYAETENYFILYNWSTGA